MICASLYRPFFIVNLLRYLAEKILLLNTTNFREDYPSTSTPRFSLAKLGPLLDAAHERLDGVVFENLDWSDLIARYDHAEALFYLDPPYFGGENDYGKGLFDRRDFQRMADQLAGLRGAFVLSINDRPEIREIFGRFIVDEVRLTYTVSSGEGTKARELIISNHEAPAGLL